MADTEVTEETGADANPPTEAQTTDAPVDSADAPPEQPAAETKAEPAKAAPKKTIAGGGESVEVPVPQDFPDNWAELLSDGNDKLQKELERLGSPKGVALAWKNANDKIRGGEKSVTVPGKDATDEERAEFFKALGVPETPDGYLDSIKLANDRVLGDADKPIVKSFAERLHATGATPETVSAATDWYFDFLEEQQSQQDQTDSEARVRSEVELKQEFGGDYARRTNAIGELVKMGTIPEDLWEELQYARTPSGHVLGNYTPFIKAFSQIALEVNPAAGMAPQDGDALASLNSRADELRAMMRDQTSEYHKDTPAAKRLQEEAAEVFTRLKAVEARRAA